MADDSTVSQQRPVGQRLKHGLESKILIPAAAGIVTLAVKYLLKKLPMLLEEKVLPKLLESDAPGKVTKAVEGTATALGGTDGEAGKRKAETDRADDAEREEDTAEQHEPARAQASNDDREAERRKREQRRQERKRSVGKAA